MKTSNSNKKKVIKINDIIKNIENENNLKN